MKEINKRHTFVQTGNQSIWGILPLGKDKLLIVCHQNYKKKITNIQYDIFFNYRKQNHKTA